ncbi:MAG: hypothetical protein JW982_11635 [Spirochaetes bacterium]|nr:hypothetical protein [Spirochaetota bacterium]
MFGGINIFRENNSIIIYIREKIYRENFHFLYEIISNQAVYHPDKITINCGRNSGIDPDCMKNFFKIKKDLDRQNTFLNIINY